MAQGRYPHGPADIIVTLGPNPPAGAEIAVTVPAGHVWVIRNLTFTLVTSAVVANRVVNLLLRQNGVSISYIANNGTNQTAGQTRIYTCNDYILNPVGAASVILTDRFLIPLPKIIMPAGAVINTNTSAIDVGDQYTLTCCLIEDYLV